MKAPIDPRTDWKTRLLTRAPDLAQGRGSRSNRWLRHQVLDGTHRPLSTHRQTQFHLLCLAICEQRDSGVLHADTGQITDGDLSIAGAAAP